MDTTDDNTEKAPAGRPLGYWLRSVDRLLTHEFATALAADGLDRRDWMLLNAVSGDVDVPWLTARLDRGGRRVRALVDRGWLAKENDAWVLTEDGRAAKDRLGATVDALRARVSGAVSPEDYATTLTTLEAIAGELGGEDALADPRWAVRQKGHRGFAPSFGRRGFGPAFGARGFGPGFPGGFGPGFGPAHGHVRPGVDPEGGDVGPDLSGPDSGRRHGNPGFGRRHDDSGFGRRHDDSDFGRRHGDPGFGRGHGGPDRRAACHHHRSHDDRREQRRGERSYERGFDAGFARGRESAASGSAA